MMRLSFWLFFFLAEFCRRCETKGTWWGVCSGVSSGFQRQSSWGGREGQGKPHEAVGFLALGWNWFYWLSENVTRCATRTSVFAHYGGCGGYPYIFHQFCANLVGGPEDSGGVKPPKPLRGLANAPDATIIYDKNHTDFLPILQWLWESEQKLSYHQQIARQLRTQYAEDIYTHKYYTVTLKSRLRVTQGHWKRNHG